MRDKSLLRSIVSFLLAFLMTFSCMPVYASWYHDMVQGSGGGSGGSAGNWSTTWVGEEFIRCSIWFFEGGIEAGNEPMIIGLPTDVRHPKYTSPNYGLPRYYSEPQKNQNTARYYNVEGGDFQEGSNYYNMVMPNLVPGKTKEEFEANQGNTSLEFPILFTANGVNGGSNGVDALEYFSNYSVKNELLASVQGNKYGSPEGSKGEWQGIENIESGTYTVGSASKSGQYIILLEPGFFGKMNGNPAGFTFRDCISMHEAGGFFRGCVDPPRNTANSLRVTDSMWETSLGLSPSGGYGGELPGGPGVLTNMDILNAARKDLGAGVITCSPSVGQIPVIHYYYDVSQHIEKFV